MSGVLQDLKTRQDAIVNNVNVISEENAFLGIETNFGSLNFYVTVLGRTYRQLPTPNRLVNFTAAWGDRLVKSSVTDAQMFFYLSNLYRQ